MAGQMRATKLAHDAVHSDDRDKVRLSEGVRKVVAALNAHPLFSTDARLIDAEPGGVPGSGIAFAVGAARSIEHGLGRAPKGFIEVYNPDLPCASHVGLFPTTHLAGETSATTVRVTPTGTGTCFLLVW